MESILEYIMEYYTWLLGGAIIILLAIIGYYADKTNFGQGKVEKKEINKEDEYSIDENQTLGETVDKIYSNQDSAKEQEKTAVYENQPTVTLENDSNNQQELKTDIVEQQKSTIPVESPASVVREEVVSNNEPESETNFEEDFSKFDKEFEEILPKKGLIDDELLDEIDSLSLDKTQKLDLNDIPDLDDVDLPKIKTFEPEEKDVWKF